VAYRTEASEAYPRQISGNKKGNQKSVSESLARESKGMLGAARQGWQGSLLLLLLLFSSGWWGSTSGINPPALSYTCGGNCPTATCQSYCPCGDYPSYIDSLTLQGYLSTYSLNEAVFVCIAETKYDDPLNPTTILISIID